MYIIPVLLASGYRPWFAPLQSNPIVSQLQSNSSDQPTGRPTGQLLIAIALLIAAITPTMNLYSTSSQLMRSCSAVLVAMFATYLSLVVLVECTVRVLLFNVGVEIGMSETKDLQCQRSKDLDQRISRSLIEQRDYKTAGSDNCIDKTTSSISRGCCSICLEDFSPDDTVVSGRKNCCNSNLFHKSCIEEWLRIKDSCPCCREPMIEPDIDEASRCKESGDECLSLRGHMENLRSQFRMKIDTASRMRTEILSHFHQGRVRNNDVGESFLWNYAFYGLFISSIYYSSHFLCLGWCFGSHCL